MATAFCCSGPVLGIADMEAILRKGNRMREAIDIFLNMPPSEFVSQSTRKGFDQIMPAYFLVEVNEETRGMLEEGARIYGDKLVLFMFEKTTAS